MKKSKILAVTAFVTIASVGASQAQELQDVRVGYSAEPYPPFTSQDASGKWVGWEVDFTNAVCAEAKLNCIITPVAWDGIIPSLTAKKIDIIVSAMGITAEREKTIAFSDKYFKMPTVIAGPKDMKFGVAPADLVGKVLGAQAATTNSDYAKKYFSEGSEIKEYQTQDEAFQDLVAGRVDAVLAESITLSDFLKTDAGQCCDIKGAVPEDMEIFGPGVGIGLRKEDVALKEKLNAAIKTIRANGTFDQISKEYFDFDIYGE